MAGRAAHIAVAHRMRRKLVEVCANLLVALVTNHGLLCFHRDRIVFLVHAMTADAGDIFALVHTALPANPMAALMASEAGAVLLGNARLRIRSEQRYRRSRVADMELLRMFCAGAVAGFALLLRKRRARIRAHRMLGLEDAGDRGFAVTLQASVRAGLRVRRRWSSISRRSGGMRRERQEPQDQQHRQPWIRAHDQSVGAARCGNADHGTPCSTATSATAPAP